MIAEGECIGGIRLVAAIGRPTLALGARSSRRSARASCPSRDYGPFAFFWTPLYRSAWLGARSFNWLSVFCASGLPGRLGTGLGCRGVFAAGLAFAECPTGAFAISERGGAGFVNLHKRPCLCLRVMIVLAYGDPYFLQKSAKRACEQQ